MRAVTTSRVTHDVSVQQEQTLGRAVLIGCVVFVCWAVYWAVRIRTRYFPTGDEFSILVHSTRFFGASVSDWFRHGFSEYFRPYPDLSVPYSNFLRPADNAVYYLDSILFGRHWSYYLLTSYAVVGALVGTVYFISSACLQLAPAATWLATLAAAVSPALTYQLIFRPSFGFDYLGGLCALLALALLLRRRFVLAWIAVCLAVFAKESAYYTAVSGCAVAFMLLRNRAMPRRVSGSLTYLLPVLAALALRKLDFANPTGVYVLNEASAGNPLKTAILGATHWPYTLPFEQHLFELSISNALSVLVTFVSWLLVLWVALRLFRTRAWRSESMQVQAQAGVLLFLAGSLTLPVALNLTDRFGASAYPLFFLLAASVYGMQQAAGTVRWAAAAILGTALVASSVSLARQLVGPFLQAAELSWERSRSLVDHLAQSRAQVSFLVADASETFSSPASLARFSGYSGAIVPLSNLGVDRCPERKLEVQKDAAGLYVIRSSAPPRCGANNMAGTFRVHTPEPSFERDLPEASAVYIPHDRPWTKGEFSSQDLEIRFRPKVSSFEILMPPVQGSTAIINAAEAAGAGSAGVSIPRQP